MNSVDKIQKMFRRTQAKVRNATTAFLISVCPYVYPHGQLATFGANYLEIFHCGLSQVFVYTFQFSLKSVQNETLLRDLLLTFTKSQGLRKKNKKWLHTLIFCNIASRKSG
jgi:hypothetical protein